MNLAVLKQLNLEQASVEICLAVPAQAVDGPSELDEMWSYVGKKDNPRWLWHAIGHQVEKCWLTYLVG